jgi:hypothetical protein
MFPSFIRQGKFDYFVRNYPKGALVMLNAILEDFEKSFGINWSCNDPGMKHGFRFVESVVKIEMTKDQENFERVLADFEIIRISSFGFFTGLSLSHPEFSISPEIY